MATSCPSCGGPLRFDEGSNAARCSHCGSNLLVTGRRQILSYVVRPRVDAAKARALADEVWGDASATAHPGVRASSPEGGVGRSPPQLWFLPYYRLTATELRWERRLPEARREGPADPRWLTGWIAAWVAEGRDAPLLFRSPREPALERGPRGVEFRGRRIERSLLACAPGIAPASLGIRTSVVLLELLRREALPPDATIAAPTLAAADALRVSLEAVDEESLVGREVLARILSLVYWPFWLCPEAARPGARVAVADAVSGTLATATADAEQLASLAGGAAQDRVLEFRPLLCPNCGSDLPVEPADVVFYCAACDRAWLVEADRLLRVVSAVAEPPTGVRETDTDYWPFWQVPRAGSGEGILVPAFRHSNLKRLNDLAVSLSRCAASFKLREQAGAELRGCAIDADDAAAMARFLAAGRKPDGMPLLPGGGSDRVELDAPRARLLWLPLLRDGYGWREPVTGMALLPELRP